MIPKAFKTIKKITFPKHPLVRCDCVGDLIVSKGSIFARGGDFTWVSKNGKKENPLNPEYAYIDYGHCKSNGPHVFVGDLEAFLKERKKYKPL